MTIRKVDSLSESEIRRELRLASERLASNPLDMDARLTRARILHATGRLDRALQDIKHAVAQPGESRHEGYVLAVRWLYQGGRKRSAEKTCARALLEFPNSLPLLRLRATFYGGTNRPGSHILKADSPKDTPPHQCINNAYELAKLGFVDSAQTYLEKAAWALRETGETLENSGEGDQTVASVELEIALQRGDTKTAREILTHQTDSLTLSPCGVTLAWLRAGELDAALQSARDHDTHERGAVCALLPYWLDAASEAHSASNQSDEVQHVLWANAGDWKSLSNVALETASANSTLLVIEAHLRQGVGAEIVGPLASFPFPADSPRGMAQQAKREEILELLSPFAFNEVYRPSVDLLRLMIDPAPEVIANVLRTFAPMIAWPEEVALSPRLHLDQLRSHAFSILDRLRGNRSFCITWLDENGDAHVGWPSPSPRKALADIRRALDTIPIDKVIEGYQRLFERYPSEPLCWTYRGEVYLWAGEYQKGIEDLEHALSMSKFTRWAWIGLAGGYVFRGSPERALEVLTEAELWVESLENGLVYRGEAHLLLNQPEQALPILLEAVEHRPTRLSAWLLLAKTRIQLGESAAPILEAVAATYPEMWQDFTLDNSEPERVVDAILEGMRGNRSSHMLTYFSPDGGFCKENTRRLRFSEKTEHSR